MKTTSLWITVLINAMIIMPATKGLCQSERIFFLDANHKKTKNKGLALYRVNATEYADSATFKTFIIADNKLHEEGTYKMPNGYLKYCTIRRYWSDENLRFEGRIQDGTPIGKWNYFYENGKPYSTIEYSKGVMNGAVIRYYSNGSIYSYGHLINKKHGAAKFTDENGRTIKSEYYYLGMADSLWTERYPESSRVKSRQKYKQGKPFYDSAWWPNGKLKYGLQYDTLGKLEGKFKYFDQEGIQCRLEQYKNGKLVKYNCFEDRGKTTTNECPPKQTKPDYKYGEARFIEHVKSYLEYPAEAMQMQVSGDVMLKLLIKADGTVSEIEIDNLIPLGYGLETSCIKLIKDYKNFIPGTFTGVSVDDYLIVPFHFVPQKTSAKDDEMED